VSRRFTRKGDALLISLSGPERELLVRWIPDQLRAIYHSDDSQDTARTRLFPRAYLDPTEEGAEEEWQALVHPELLRSRLDALTRVVGALDEAAPGRRGSLVVELGPDDVPALLGVVNDARLALGTILDVNDDTDLGDLDPADPAAQTSFVYLWLTHFEGELVDTLLGDMPD
jgi:hypothetical protein